MALILIRVMAVFVLFIYLFTYGRPMEINEQSERVILMKFGKNSQEINKMLKLFVKTTHLRRHPFLSRYNVSTWAMTTAKIMQGQDIL